MDNLEQIAAVPGIDVLTLGPWDLSFSLGLNPLELPLPEVEEITDRALAIASKHEVAIGSGCSTPDEVDELKERGITFLSYGPDYSLLVNAAREGTNAFNRIKK